MLIEASIALTCWVTWLTCIHKLRKTPEFKLLIKTLLHQENTGLAFINCHIPKDIICYDHLPVVACQVELKTLIEFCLTRNQDIPCLLLWADPLESSISNNYTAGFSKLQLIMLKQ